MLFTGCPMGEFDLSRRSEARWGLKQGNGLNISNLLQLPMTPAPSSIACAATCTKTLGNTGSV
jgi:hypothetical protein